MSQFVQEANVISYTPGVDVAAGAIVEVGELVGIASQDIPANTLGSLTIEGAIRAPKENALDLTQTGTLVNWDAAAGEVNLDLAEAQMGITIESSPPAQTDVLVKLVPAGRKAV